MTRRVACILLLLLVGGGLSATAHGACFEGLGFILEGSVEGNASAAWAVSADGSVIVGRAVYEVIDWGGGQLEPIAQAVMWRNGVLLPVISHAPGSQASSSANGVSADGSVIIGAESGSGLGWRWEDGVVSALEPLPSYNRTSAADVSSDGSVVVGYSTTLSDFDKPVRWDDGVVSALDLLPDGNSGKARGVSDDGSAVVGWSGRSGYPSIEAVRWQGGEVQGLGFLWLPSSTISQAEAVSGDGLVAVGAHGVPFRYEGGTMTALTGPAGPYSVAKASNADGSVIVGYGVGVFRWTEATGTQNLADLLTTQYGLDLTGWHLTVASDISADGKTIVGHGNNPDGKQEAYRAVLEGPCRTLPPVPTMSPTGLAVFVLVLITAAFIATRGLHRQYM